MTEEFDDAICPGCPLPHEDGAERPWRNYQAGEELLSQGQVHPDLLRIRSGVVLLTALDASGEETLVCLRGAGACFNLDSIEGRPSMVRAEALTDVVVCHLSGDNLCQAVRDGGDSAPALLSLALDEARAWATGRRRASGRRAVARLAQLLLEMDGLGSPPASVPRTLIARLLSIRPETLSRTIQELRDAGAIGADLDLIDRGKLSRLARS